MGATKGWFARRAEEEAKNDRLSPSEIAGDVAYILVLLALIWIFISHQTASTGFFTTEFGQTEALLIYGPPLLAIITTAAKTAVGRKNMFRPLEVAGIIFAIVALVWYLFVVFPFDFSDLPDVLPGFLRFLLQWISNDIARGLMALAMIIDSVGAVYIAALYVYVRREYKS